MKKLLYIPFLTLLMLSATAQVPLCKRVHCSTVDDRREGYVLVLYRIPEDGAYTFSVDGGLCSKTESTIYYYEYRFKLAAGAKQFAQPTLNISSQAQDGDVCHFSRNEKNNKISGEFLKDELVEVRLELLKADVNGEPHKKLRLTKETMVYVEKHKPLAVNN